MAAKLADYDALDYFRITEVKLILSAVLILCSGILIYDWVKKSYRNLPPGPRGLPFVGYQPFIGAEPHKTVAELGKKYGGIFGMHMGATYTVFLTEYNVMKEAYTQNASLDRPAIFTFIPDGLGFGTKNGEEWQEQRRFSMQSMRNVGLGKGPWETCILDEAQEFVDSLGMYKGKPMNVSFLLTSSVNSNIVSLLIGRKMNKSEDYKNIKLMVELTHTLLVNSLNFDFVYSFPWVRKLLSIFKIGVHHKIDALLEKFTDFLRNEIKVHETSEEFKNTEDFINMYRQQLIKSNLLEANRRFFSETNLRGNLLVLFFGASDTISTSVTWMFTLMAAYPDVQHKVHMELDNVIGKDVRVYYDDRKNIPYTMAVIMETLRFAVIVPMSTARLVREDMTVKGYTIPKGTNIVTDTWALHNDPNYWEQPEKFMPERFLSSDGKEILKLKSYAPFSYGKRNCPGETVAYMAIYLFFTAVMQKFEVRPPQGKQMKFDIDFGLVCSLKPQEFCFIARK